MAIYLIKDDRSTPAIISRTPFSEEEIDRVRAYLESKGFTENIPGNYSRADSAVGISRIRRDKVQVQGPREVLKGLIEILQPKFFLTEASAPGEIQPISEVFNSLK